MKEKEAEGSGKGKQRGGRSQDERVNLGNVKFN
jgi:hypothetical protein